MGLGKSIRIYLKDGSVTGIKFAEVVNQTIQAFSCPRTKISDLNYSFTEQINTQGVYFLIGFEDEILKQVIYIGEAENVWERLKNHDSKKDFWNEVIVFTSKDDNLTKSHIKYLESRIVQIANQTKRYDLKNGNNPSLSSLPLPDKDAMEEFLLNIRSLSGILGHKFLEDPMGVRFIQDEKMQKTHVNNNSADILTDNMELFLDASGITASAIQTNEGLVVLRNSLVSEKHNNSYGYANLRNSLLKEGVIKEDSDGKLFFDRNYLFNSASAAAGVVLGYSANGRQIWKDRLGKSIKEIEKKELN